MSDTKDVCRKLSGESLLTSKLSIDAPEFRPGRNQPSPKPEPEVNLPPPPGFDFPPNNLRTSSCAEKIYKNLNAEDGTKKSANFDGLKSADVPKNEEFGKLNACDVVDMEGNSGWKISGGQNRRQRPQNKSGNRSNDLPQRNQGFGRERMPGETVTLDGSPRFVVWSPDVDVARRSIAQGRSVLVLMRGVPGSGKSTLARSLQGNGIICSADGYFLQEDNSYQFDRTRLEAAHTWCLQRAIQAVTSKDSPVIIDNTNICLWEMAKYVKLAIRNNYDIYFLEPETPWKRNASECARRNTHRVPIESIERMIQQFETVTGLRPFVESGILRTPITKPACVPPQPVTQMTNPARVNVSRSSSSSDVIEMKKDSRGTLSPADDWGSSDSSSWTNDEQSKVDAMPSAPPGLQLSASASSIPKSQRAPRPSSQTDGMSISPNPKVQDAKKTDTPIRRRRPDGYGGLAFGFSASPWQLPNDLVGGLTAAKQEETAPRRQLTSLSVFYREICVRDGCTQVSEKHLAFADLQHRRLSRQSIDGCEFELEERTVKKDSGSGSIVSCDAGIQCDHDGSMISSEEDSRTKAMATLRSCFPQVNVDDIEDIFTGCGGQLEWAVNVLLDSGYDMDWSTIKDSAEKEITNEWKTENEFMEQEAQEFQSIPEAEDRVQIAAASGKNAAYESSQSSGIKTSLDTGPAPSASDGDGESPLYPMELSVDMAKELQRIFTSIYPDIPPDLLGPSQLKLRLTHEVAAAIFRCWLDTQANSGFAEGDSDFCSDGSLSDEFAVENNPPLGKFNGVNRDDDVIATERQILMDEQLARQLAAEEENFNQEPNQAAADSPASSSSMSSQLKLKRLYELFPSVDRTVLKGLFTGNNCHLDKTIDMLSDMYDVPKQQRTASPGRGYASRAAQKPPVTREEASDPNEPDLTYQELRQEAFLHHEERQANFKKAQDYFRKGMAEVAYYYAQRGHLHNAKFKEANERAARKILQQRKDANPAGVLDLHGLHVSEAIHALVDILREYENRPGKEIKIITGQGLHSANGPKIKPAVMNHLRQRGYSFSQSTPGVFVVTIK